MPSNPPGAEPREALGRVMTGETARRERLELLDPLRILASVAVVWHHATKGYLFGVGFGLFLFLVIMFGLASSGSRAESVGEFARRKAAYVLVPWLRWSAIYVVVLVAADVARGADPRGRFEPAMVFYGGHASLWFLPFAALALGPVKALSKGAGRVGARTTVVLAAALGAIATIAADYAVMLDIADVPWRSWIRVAPAILWGTALGQSLRVGERDRKPLLLVVAVIAYAACTLSPVFSSGGVLREDLPGRFGMAVALACLGFGWNARVPAIVRKAATLTFGVYLVHPLVMKLVGAAFDVRSWTPLEHASLVWLGAASIVLALRRTPVRWHECAVPRAAGSSA